MDEDAFSYKSIHPEIEVSMSTHSIESVKAAYEHDLDYVFGHIFKTPSKPNQLPRSKAEIQCVLEIPIQFMPLEVSLKNDSSITSWF